MMRRLLAACGLVCGLLASAAADAAGTVQMISHRYPQLEFYAEKMKTALPGVPVETQLMPIDKAMELATIALSAKADTVDIVYQSEATFLKFVKNGWLRPLDDLWDKYRAEFDLDDFPASVRQSLSYEGKLYVMPHTLNVMLMFYRKDLLGAKGLQPPTTFEDYLAQAKSFNTPLTAGTINCLKPVDAGLNEAHWYLNALGDGWFDAANKPVFNSPKGVAALETLKQVTGFAQRGFASAANDECSIALQQGIAVMGLQWASRAGSMDDPKKSTVIGKIDWATPPLGHQRISVSGYAISAFSKQDPDTLFKIIATSANAANMREGAVHGLPVRSSLLGDQALKEQYRYFPASLEAVKVAQSFPPMPEFYEVGEFITRRMLQGITGEMPMQAAMDAAAKETEGLLRSRGYYQ